MPQEYKAFIERMLKDAKTKLSHLEDSHRIEIASFNAKKEVIECDIRMYEMFLEQKANKENNNPTS